MLRAKTIIVGKTRMCIIIEAKYHLCQLISSQKLYYQYFELSITYPCCNLKEKTTNKCELFSSIHFEQSLAGRQASFVYAAQRYRTRYHTYTKLQVQCEAVFS